MGNPYKIIMADQHFKILDKKDNSYDPQWCDDKRISV